jgi:co-chaperonin GroES (HSP10)
MKLKVMAGRVVVKQHAAKLKGAIHLPPNRAKLYEIGEVVAVGALDGYGPEGKYSTKETYAPGDLVLFQLPQALAGNITFDIKGVLNCFLHAEDIIAKLSSDVIELGAFKIAGRFMLLQPSVRHESLIVLPDNAEEAKKENLHFSVLQMGADVKHDLAIGQEVFPDKGRVNPMTIENKELVFADQQFIYGSLGTD